MYIPSASKAIVILTSSHNIIVHPIVQDYNLLLLLQNINPLRVAS